MTGTTSRSRSAVRPLLAMALVTTSMLALGWGTFFLVILPGEYLMGGQAVFGTGLAVTAFMLGARHGFDADHIAAIDNTTRKLLADGERPVTVGHWFALGHSSVVIVTVALLAAGFNALAEQLTTERSALTTFAGVWGVLISGLFLLFIGLTNLFSLHGMLRVFRGMRGGQLDEVELERVLTHRGGLYRVFGPVARRVDRPWKMYPIGILFGLGFDTATTVALFVVGGTAAITAPWYVVLVLPVLFAGGMILVDTLDGVIMHHAYAWAFHAPVRKVYYNMTITLLSVAVAFLVGGLGLLTLIADALHADHGPLGWVAGLNLENLGFVVVAVLILTWAVAWGYWKLAKVEARYGHRPPTAQL